jgi:pimeloyl-ACP methyl ester carboxylesterase
MPQIRRRTILLSLMIAALTVSLPTRADEAPRFAERPGVRIAYFAEGNGPPVLMIPSLGRGAEDFAALAAAVAAAGYRAIRLQPRGIPPSTGPLQGLTMDDLAQDAAAVLQADGGGPAVVIGHAFGQRVARTLAARHPDAVRALIMLAAGGKAPMLPGAQEALFASFDPSLPADKHMEAVRIAFFAPGNDPAIWHGGWYQDVAKAQSAATEASDVATWWSAGGRIPILVVQGLQDKVAPPENGRMLKQAEPDRVVLVELDGAGHALLPEKPDEIARQVVSYLQHVDPTPGR